MKSLPAIVLVALSASACQQAAPEASRLTYPVAAKGDVVDDYGGTTIPDPYRWMEALDSKEVATGLPQPMPSPTRIWRSCRFARISTRA